LQQQQQHLLLGLLRLAGMVACYVTMLESNRRAQTNCLETALSRAGCQDLKLFIQGSAANHDATLRISSMLTRMDRLPEYVFFAEDRVQTF